MKWKCIYRPEETMEAGADLAVLMRSHPKAKVRRKTSKRGELVIYIEDRLSKVNISLAKPQT